MFLRCQQNIMLSLKKLKLSMFLLRNIFQLLKRRKFMYQQRLDSFYVAFFSKNYVLIKSVSVWRTASHSQHFLCFMQIKRDTETKIEKTIHIEHPRPRTASPHFTVSKIAVPKPDHTYEVRSENRGTACSFIITTSHPFCSSSKSSMVLSQEEGL